MMITDKGFQEPYESTILILIHLKSEWNCELDAFCLRIVIFDEKLKTSLVLLFDLELVLPHSFALGRFTSTSANMYLNLEKVK